jgi:predicted permease
MKWINILSARLHALLRRDRVSQDIEEELRIHLEMETQTYLDRGMSPEEAQVAAQNSFGNRGRIGDLAHDIRGGGWLDSLWQDLRFGVRQLFKSPGFTAVAVLSLALGIGANTAIFSLTDAVLLKMAPVAQPEQLHFIANAGARDIGGAPPYPCFELFRRNNNSFTGIAAFRRIDPKVRIDGQIEEVRGQSVSGDFFSLLGVPALLGRTLRPEDDSIPKVGGPDGLVAVISHNYWTNRFGQDPAVIGKTIRIDDRAATIVGVTPPEFYGLYPGVEINISVPMMVGGPRLAARQDWWFQAVGRLKPGVGLEKARAELDAIFQSYIGETNISAEDRRDYFARIELPPAGKGLDLLRERFSKPLQALTAIAALVLSAACANVAILLLARATARRKEFAVRLALGAGWGRLIRQLLTESFLLVGLGGLLGLLVARWSSAFLVSFFDSGANRIFVNLPLDSRMLLFTAGVAILTGLLFGLAPALQTTRIDPNPALKENAAAHASTRFRLGKLLVVIQVAVSLILLIIAGLFLQTLYNIKNIDAGFLPERVLTMRINPSESVYERERLNNLWKEILARVENIPGIRVASLSTLSPMSGDDRGCLTEVSGFTPRSQREKQIRINQVSPGFFPSLGVAVRQGRGFTTSDNETAPRAALINEAAARFYFHDRNPIGERITPFYYPEAGETFEIVGVVSDARYSDLRRPDSRLVYLPLMQSLHRVEQLTLAVRAAGDPTQLLNSIRNEIRAAGTDILLTDISTLENQVDQSLRQERLVSSLTVIFGALALLLSCMGLYGVMSFTVTRRTHEIGVRMALGAQKRDVVKIILRETLMLVAIGALIGLGAALATSRMIASLLFGLTPTDPLTIGLAAVLILAASALASYLPARRASRVDPMAALRSE